MAKEDVLRPAIANNHAAKRCVVVNDEVPNLDLEVRRQWSK